jgi:hypothetical protein
MFGESRVVPCGWTDGRTDMTKLMVDFYNFVNASKKKKSLQRGRTRKQERFYDNEEDKKSERRMDGRKVRRKEKWKEIYCNKNKSERGKIIHLKKVKVGRDGNGENERKCRR